MERSIETNAYEKYENLRKLIDDRADWHLNNWGNWARGERLEIGYPGKSGCLETLSGSGVASDEASQHRDESSWNWLASVCDSIIRNELQHAERIVLSRVYESAKLSNVHDIESALIEASKSFWKRAQRKGLA